MKTLLITALLLITFSSSQAGSIMGIVFNDLNNNGIREKNEIGIKGVAVSDQVIVAVTDANGFYQIASSKGFGYVFISLPNGYKITKPFYQKVISPAGNSQIDFALTKVPVPTEFKFIHGSDTHISEATIDRTEKFLAIADSVRPDFVIVTGDLVKDALRVSEKEATSLYDLYKKEVIKFPMPVWSAPGNHENFGIERELSKVSADNTLYGRKMYRSYLGPDYYSFNYGGIHFVALNSVDFEDMWYYGHIDSVQIDWLKKDLAAIPAKTPVVTFQHIPFFSAELSLTGYTESGPGRTLEKEKGVPQFRHVVSNAHDVINIVRSRPYPLALGGHHHKRQRFYLENEGQQTRYEQSSSVIASFTEGAFTIPSGVVLYQVKDGEIDEGTFITIKP